MTLGPVWPVPFPNSSERRITSIADDGFMFDTVQTKLDLADKLFFHLLKEDSHEYRDRTFTGTCDGNINFAGPEVFKLFRGRVFDSRGYLGASTP